MSALPQYVERYPMVLEQNRYAEEHAVSLDSVNDIMLLSSHWLLASFCVLLSHARYLLSVSYQGQVSSSGKMIVSKLSGSSRLQWQTVFVAATGKERSSTFEEGARKQRVSQYGMDLLAHFKMPVIGHPQYRPF